MPSWTESQVINASPEVVYTRTTDLDQCPQWIPQITHIKKDFSGPMRVGDSWQETRKEGKREHTMTITVYESRSPGEGDAPYVHTAGAEVMGMKSYYRYTFEPEGEEQCRVRLEAVVESKGWFKTLFATLMMKMMQKSEAGHLQRLKTFIEAGAERAAK